MILDHRTYLTLYAVLAVAWLMAPAVIASASIKTSSRYMCAGAAAAVLVGLVNYLDWLWS